MKFDKMSEKLEKKLNDIEELTEVNEYIKQLPHEIARNQTDIESLMKIYDSLEVLKYKLNKEDQDNRWNIFKKPKKTYQLIDRRKLELEKKRDEFLKIMEEAQKAFMETVKEYQNNVDTFTNYDKLDNY